MDRRKSGFTLIEAMITIAIIGVMAGIGGWLMENALGDTRARGGVRSMADLMMLGRTEAIRTGDNHVVFFSADTGDNALTGVFGQPAAALLIRDLDADGLIDAGEKVASVNVDDTGHLSWGSTFAAVVSTPPQAPDDNAAAQFPEPDADFLCCTFLEPDADPARWIVFLPDGTPRGFSVGPFVAGGLTTGNGAVYVTSGTRDYAVVLAPLGGVRVHTFERGPDTWTN